MSVWLIGALAVLPIVGAAQLAAGGWGCPAVQSGGPGRLHQFGKHARHGIGDGFRSHFQQFEYEVDND